MVLITATSRETTMSLDEARVWVTEQEYFVIYFGYGINIGIKCYLAIDKSNNPRNCFSEVWYITFTEDISVIRKYSVLPRDATGRNSSRAVFILISVSAAICSFWATSVDVILVEFSTFIRSSSSTREPCSK